MPYYNNSHCADNTAGQALLKIEESEEQERMRKTINSMLVFAKKHGYLVTSKIVLTRMHDEVQGL